MAGRRPTLAAAVAEPASPTEAEAQMEVARALHRLADVGEALTPAADTIAGLGDRLEALCTWLKGKWPWLVAIGFLVLQRTVNMAPEDVPALVEALSRLAGAIGGGT